MNTEKIKALLPDGVEPAGYISKFASEKLRDKQSIIGVQVANTPNRYLTDPIYTSDAILAAIKKQDAEIKQDLLTACRESEELSGQLAAAQEEIARLKAHQRHPVCVFHEVAERDAEVMTLRTRPAAAQEEIALLKGSHERSVNLRNQLAASQLHAEQLRSCLGECLPHVLSTVTVTGNYLPTYKYAESIYKSTHDTSALDDYTAEVEQRTAEACRSLLKEYGFEYSRFDQHKKAAAFEAAKAIRQGEWRKFRKESE